MRVLSLSPGLRTSACLLLLFVPLAALETIIVSRSPWWNLPLRNMGFWASMVAGCLVPLVVFIMRGQRWAFRAAATFILTWIVLGAWVSIRTRTPALGFFSLFMTLFSGGILIWLRQEIRRSFMDPRIRWYESLPKPIPQLECVHAESTESFRVSRLDERGCFVYLEKSNEKELKRTWKQSGVFKKTPVYRLGFKFGVHTLICSGYLRSELTKAQGAGFEFCRLSPDEKKELGDFVELLRGHGYVE